MGSAAQLIVGLIVCFVFAMLYAAYSPYLDRSDDRLATVCQVSLFFSLVSSIALKMERDTSADALGVLLVVSLCVPPVLAIAFQGGDVVPSGPRLVRRIVADATSAMSHWFGKNIGVHLKRWLVEKCDESMVESRERSTATTIVSVIEHADVVEESKSDVVEEPKPDVLEFKQRVRLRAMLEDFMASRKGGSGRARVLPNERRHRVAAAAVAVRVPSTPRTKVAWEACAT